MTRDIISKLKKQNLLGRGGAGFPAWQKWHMVKKANASKKYIICNGSEGEPGVFKDGYILENYPETVVEGLKIALKTIDNSSAYICLRKDYYQKFKVKLEKLIKGFPIVIFQKTGGYLAGEETTIINAIEGKKRLEPRIKPPLPSQAGLFGCPTLINNVETFYYVSKIAENEYKKTRFYSISGEVKNKGVYEMPENYPISEVLKKTNNYPDFDFFAQVGGGASGEILLKKELGRSACGAGAIIIFDKKKTNPVSLMKKWADFFAKENCDKCAPCREGAFRIQEILKSKNIDKKLLDDLMFVLKETSFCALGAAIPVPFESFLKKVYTF
ncbi:MAG: NADH-ubiquinone oxidoreductase-F iron-sulfur binding region domain-containing protein [Patescibacteria group bacterium]